MPPSLLLIIVLLTAGYPVSADELFNEGDAWARCAFADIARAHEDATTGDKMATWANARTWLTFCESDDKASDFERIDRAIKTFVQERSRQANAVLLGQRGHVLGRLARLAPWWDFCGAAEAAYAGFQRAYQVDPTNFRAALGLGAIQAGVLGTRPWSHACDLGGGITWPETLAFLDQAAAHRDAAPLFPIERLMATATLVRAYERAFDDDATSETASLDVGTRPPVNRIEAVRAMREEIAAGLARLPATCSCISRAVDEALN